MVEEVALEVMSSLLAGWGGLAVGEEEAIPTDGLQLMVRIIDGRTAYLPGLSVCNVVYAELVRIWLD